MNKIIETPHAPAPIGPYSQAVLADNNLYVSGQISLNPTTGDMVQTSIEDETHQVMKNLQAVLAEARMEFSDVVKCSIFIMDMGQFAAINAVYGQYFKANPPARETVQVAALPKGARVEISCVAVKSPQ